jgi:Arc/MetJ-type ribon-helix-helix transcriptional regulator
MTKKVISATIDSKLIKWIDEELKNSQIYRNKSHLIEIAINILKEQNEKTKK